MVAADDSAERDSSATPATIALRTDVFLALTAKVGAHNDVARARLFGVDRATIRRMKTHQFAPRLELAMRMAECLGTTVDELFERVAA